MYATRAMKVHAKHRDWPHVAKLHLHSAAILSKLRRHAEAVRCLGQVLHLVETGDLDDDGNAPHKLCLVAVTHHNIAVEQLLLHHVEEAVVSAQNARRLARLCLSYSNRWLDKFESTHRCSAEALAAMGGTLVAGMDKHRDKLRRGSKKGAGDAADLGPRERRKTVMIAAG